MTKEISEPSRYAPSRVPATTTLAESRFAPSAVVATTNVDPAKPWPALRASDYRGFYINLDRSADRRASVEQQLRSLGVTDKYQRIAGFDAKAAGQAGYEGCFQSNVLALTKAYESGAPLAHIVEDDVELSRHTGRFLQSGRAARLTQQFDLVFLDMSIDVAEFETWRGALNAATLTDDFEQIATVDLRTARLGATASYLLRRESIPKVLWFLNLPSARRWAIDAALKLIVREGGLSAVAVVPFLTSISLTTGINSLVQSVDAEETRALIQLRRKFFVDELLGES